MGQLSSGLKRESAVPLTYRQESLCHCINVRVHQCTIYSEADSRSHRMPRVLCSLSLASFMHNFNSYFQWLLTPGQACNISRKESYSYKTIRIRKHPLNNHHIVQAQIISSLPLAHLGLDVLHGIPIAGLVCTT